MRSAAALALTTLLLGPTTARAQPASSPTLDIAQRLRAHLVRAPRRPTKAVTGEARGAVVVLRGDAGEFAGDWAAPRRPDGLGPDGREHPFDRGLRNVVDGFAAALPDEDPHFLTVLTTFGADRPAPLYLPLANDVTGIGWQRVWPTETFALPGRALEGVVFMGPLRAFESERAALGTSLFLQEVGHRWGVFAHAIGPDGEATTLHLGRDCAHWSAFADSGDSALGGNTWAATADGRWLPSGAVPRGYHDLDRYLMGVLPAEAAAPMTVLRGPGWPCDEVERAGARNPAWAGPVGLGGPDDAVEATPWTLRAADLVAAEGPRVPDHARARRTHRMAFVLVARPGDDVDDVAIARVDALRRRWEAAFEGAASAPGWPEPDLVTSADAGPPDAGRVDAGPPDAEPRDAARDADGPDAGPDSAVADASVTDAAPGDSGAGAALGSAGGGGGCGAAPARGAGGAGLLALLLSLRRRGPRCARGSAPACPGPPESRPASRAPWPRCRRARSPRSGGSPASS